MYTATVIKYPFNKTYKCKGHKIILENKSTMLILENEERVFIPNKYIIHFSDGWFKMELANAQKDSQGKAVINNGLRS